LLSAAIPTLSEWHVVLRIVLAAALGGAIGIERELRDREAGLRTHMLVSMGSALFTLVSAYGFHDFLVHGGSVVRTDPSRIAAQIVTGIGFLGAGAIIREGLSVRGLTTAATLWVVAAIGMAAGAGYTWAAVVTTVLVLVALWPLRLMAYHVVERFRPEENRLVVELRPGHSASAFLRELETRRLNVRDFELQDEPDRRVVTVEVDELSQEAVAQIADLEDVIGTKWHR
jgi:putative Mg2+ transporter-C (MgtC) family protein